MDNINNIDFGNNAELITENSPNVLIESIHKSAIVSEVKNNKEIQSKFIEQAKKTVNDELETLNQVNQTKKQIVTFKANKEACKLYGIDEHVPLWQVKLMKIGSGFWFIIYFIFASLTIAPVNMFFKGINSFIKNNVLVFIFALLCYLIILLGIPTIINIFTK